MTGNNERIIITQINSHGDTGSGNKKAGNY